MSRIIRSTTPTFEGVIPQGEYGGGTVMVWDQRQWEPEEEPRRGYRAGKLKFRLTAKSSTAVGRWSHGRPRGRGRQELAAHQARRRRREVCEQIRRR